MALVARLIVLIVVAVAAIVGGVWLLTSFNWPQTHDSFSWEYLVLGFLISHVLLRPIWRPAGATLNGYLLNGKCTGLVTALRCGCGCRWHRLWNRERFTGDASGPGESS